MYFLAADAEAPRLCSGLLPKSDRAGTVPLPAISMISMQLMLTIQNWVQDLEIRIFH